MQLNMFLKHRTLSSRKCYHNFFRSGIFNWRSSRKVFLSRADTGNLEMFAPISWARSVKCNYLGFTVKYRYAGMISWWLVTYLIKLFWRLWQFLLSSLLVETGLRTYEKDFSWCTWYHVARGIDTLVKRVFPDVLHYSLSTLPVVPYVTRTRFIHSFNWPFYFSIRNHVMTTQQSRFTLCHWRMHVFIKNIIRPQLTCSILFYQMYTIFT